MIQRKKHELAMLFSNSAEVRNHPVDSEMINTNSRNNYFLAEAPEVCCGCRINCEASERNHLDDHRLESHLSICFTQ